MFWFQCCTCNLCMSCHLHNARTSSPNIMIYYHINAQPHKATNSMPTYTHTYVHSILGLLLSTLMFVPICKHVSPKGHNISHVSSCITLLLLQYERPRTFFFQFSNVVSYTCQARLLIYTTQKRATN